MAIGEVFCGDVSDAIKLRAGAVKRVLIPFALV